MRQCQPSVIAEIPPTLPMGGSSPLGESPATMSARPGLSQVPVGRRLLWVDDSRLLLSLYKSIFEDLGFEVVATSSPVEALEHLAWGKADLAILDYDMPEMDGGILASLIKDRHPMLPVILYSGNISVPSSTRQRVDAVCVKGAAREELLDTIERLAISESTAHVMKPPQSLRPRLITE